MSIIDVSVSTGHSVDTGGFQSEAIAAWGQTRGRDGEALYLHIGHCPCECDVFNTEVELDFLSDRGQESWGSGGISQGQRYPPAWRNPNLCSLKQYQIRKPGISPGDCPNKATKVHQTNG